MNYGKKKKQFPSHGYECSITAIYRTTKFLGKFHKICKSHLMWEEHYNNRCINFFFHKMNDLNHD